MLDEVAALSADGLVTLERARMLAAPRAARAHEATKLTVYVGRQERAGGPATRRSSTCCAAAASPARPCCSASTAPPTACAARARFFGRNADVPLMVISVGAAAAHRGGAARADAMLARPLVTLERVRVCKRDGAAAEPRARPDRRRLRWQKLMVYA